MIVINPSEMLIYQSDDGRICLETHLENETLCWRIKVSGESALNLLGLSTQIPAQYIYLSDGPSKSYDVMGIQLTFKKSSLKDIGFKHRESMVIVQALKALGKEHLSESVFAKIRAQIAKESFAKILRDTQGSTGWIYEAIKQTLFNDEGIKQ